jgi:RNA polymerase sigma-70 factor (ECF subfamily)
MSSKKKQGQQKSGKINPEVSGEPNPDSEEKIRPDEDQSSDPLSDENKESLDQDNLEEDENFEYLDQEEEESQPEKKKAPEPEKLTSRQEDYNLIDDICDGPPKKRDQAYKRLLSKYRGQIFSLILKIIHNQNEVEDLVQETFSKAFNSIENFNKEYAFSTWLYRIATNSSIDYLRKRRLKTFSIDNPISSKDDEYTIEIPDTSDDPGKNLIQSQRDALVREAIKSLPPKYQKVIEMRHLKERTYEEISTELDLPLGTVKAHIFRAREMLYKMLRDKLRNY